MENVATSAAAPGAGKLKPPHRDGWLEVYEELERLTTIENKKREYVKRWVLLRDCWLYLYNEEAAVTEGRNAMHVVSVNLRGSLCQRHPDLQRTFVLESSALFTIAGQRHVYLMRANAEEEVEEWLADINRSAIWDMVLRATADSLKKKAKKKKPKSARAEDDDASSVASSRVSRTSRSSSRSAQSAARTGTEAVPHQASQTREQAQTKPKLEEIREVAPAADSAAASKQNEALQPAETESLPTKPDSETGDMDKIHISVQPDLRRAAGHGTSSPHAAAPEEAPQPMRIVPTAVGGRGGETKWGIDGASSGGESGAKEGSSRVLGAPVFTKNNPLARLASPSHLSRPLPAVADAAGAAASGLADDVVPRREREEESGGERAGAGGEAEESGALLGRGAGEWSSEGGAESGRASREEDAMSYPSWEGASASEESGAGESGGESEATAAEEEASSSDSSEEERREAERREFFRDAYCVRGSDSEEDIADLDQRLEPRDAFEERVQSTRRVRRFYRRKVMVYGVPYSWGNGHNYCLGHGAARDEKFPVQLKALRKQGIVQMAVGPQHCLALSASGQVYSWGVGLFGRLGHSDMRDCVRPRMVGLTKKDFNGAQVACGTAHSAALTAEGEVWCWGMGLYGELGQGSRRDHWEPRAVGDGLQGLVVCSVACGEHFTLAATTSGAVFAWGRGRYGSLGLGSVEDSAAPRRVEALRRERIVKVECGRSHALALREDGVLYGWGRGRGGAHGQGHASDALVPGRVRMAGARIVVDMACGAHHCALLTIRGEAFCWGSGLGYALGTGDEQDAFEPVRVRAVRKFVMVQVACGGTRTAALARGGNLYLWGGASAVADAEVFRDTSYRFGYLEVHEEGGVEDPEQRLGMLSRLRQDLRAPQLFPDAKTDALPVDVLRAAHQGEVDANEVLRLRFQLTDGARKLAELFGVSRAAHKWLQALPELHPDWADEEEPEEAGGVGGGGPGARQMVRVQTAAESVSGMHEAVQELLKDEVEAAGHVLQLAMAAASSKASAGPRAVAARERREAEGDRVGDVHLRDGFDLAGALDATQALLGTSRNSRESGRRAQRPMELREGRGLPRATVKERPREAAAEVEDGGGEADHDGSGEGDAESGEESGEEVEGGRGPKRHPLSRPRLLRFLVEEVAHVALGDGVTIACCNKEDAARGVMARVGMRVSAELRRKGRRAEREAAQAVRDAEEAERLRETRKGLLAGGGKGAAGGGGGSVAQRKGRRSEELSVGSAAGGDGGGAGEGGSDTVSVTASTQSHKSAGAPAGEAGGVAASGRASVDGSVGEEQEGGASGTSAMSELQRRQKPKQGWLLVHEVRLGLTLPKRMQLDDVGRGKMEWVKRWAVVRGNQLLLFSGPEAAEPTTQVVLDGYYIRDSTKDRNWTGPMGEQVAKEDGERSIPTLEVKSSGMVMTTTRAGQHHLYCRARDDKALKRWLRAIKHAAVLCIVRSSLQPVQQRPWDEHVSWSTPTSEEAWSRWRTDASAAAADGAQAELSSAASVEGGQLPLPALVGSQLATLSTELDDTRGQLQLLKEHLRELDHQHAQARAQWALRERELEEALEGRTRDVAESQAEAAQLKFEGESNALRLRAMDEEARGRREAEAEARRVRRELEEVKVALEEARAECEARKRVNEVLAQQSTAAGALSAHGRGVGAREDALETERCRMVAVAE